MDDQYKDAIIESAKEKLKSAGKALSEPELLRGIVHLLKKNHGKDDRRHSSKGRFKSQSFKIVIETSDWKKAIKQLPDKKFIRAENYELEVDKLVIEEDWNWEKESKEKAVEKLITILKKVDEYKFEYLVKDVLLRFYPDYTFKVTKSSGDQGRDVIGESIDHHDSEKKKVIIVQVKRYSKSVSRPEADKFVGAIMSFVNEKNSNVSKLIPIFVTSGKYSKGFIQRLREASADGRGYLYWDGRELANKMINYGMGVKFSIDLEFWKEVDSSMLPLNNSEKDSTG